jgi:hypothetical protein
LRIHGGAHGALGTSLGDMLANDVELIVQVIG